MRARLLAAFFLLFLINSVLLVLSLLLSYDSSRKQWNDMVEKESRKLIVDFITENLEERGVLDLESSEDIMNSSHAFLTGASQIFLFNPEGVPIRSWTNPILERDSYHNPDISSAEPLLTDGRRKGFVQIVPLSFSHVKYNRIFIIRVIRLLAIGFVISTGLSILLAFRISGRFTREARNTARSLINLAGGSRSEDFIPSPTRELSSINSAARTLQTMLVEEEERRMRWSLSFAHDLRTPLAALKTQFAALRDGVLQPTPQRWEKLSGELDTIECLARDLMVLDDLDRSGEKLNISLIRTEDIRRHLDDVLSPLARAKRISVEWDIRLDEFRCDHALTLKALEALVKNALQHTDGPARVEVSVKGSANLPRISVKNPGRIPEEDLPHLFDPLYKTDKSRKKEGSGLGLTISRKIARFHKGDLTAENLPDGRVSFNFRLNLN